MFPESITQEQRDRASGKNKGKARDQPAGALDSVEEAAEDEAPVNTGIIRNFLSPLALFLPVPIFVDGSARKRKDWSLTLLAGAMFGYMLSTVRYFLPYSLPSDMDSPVETGFIPTQVPLCWPCLWLGHYATRLLHFPVGNV